MCVSMYPARLSRTVGLLHLANVTNLGEVVVVGYQNRVQNLASGPNAMILHFPAKQGMGQNNFLDTSRTPAILDDMEKAITPRNRGGDRESKSLTFSTLSVFEHDIYTVVLTNDPKLLPEVLASNLIPKNKRPAINPALFQWYANQKPGYSFAVCCFDSREAKSAAPFLVYYKPRSSQYFEFPGLDAHTGDAPDPDELVRVDHTVVVSSYKMNGGYRVNYTDNIPGDLAPFLPTRVIGKRYSSDMANGDFRYYLPDVEAGSMDSMTRVW